jgi:hypothetical protein
MKCELPPLKPIRWGMQSAANQPGNSLNPPPTRAVLPSFRLLSNSWFVLDKRQPNDIKRNVPLASSLALRLRFWHFASPIDPERTETFERRSIHAEARFR